MSLEFELREGCCDICGVQSAFIVDHPEHGDTEMCKYHTKNVTRYLEAEVKNVA